MPGLLRGIARTAVIAGTATAVSGRVERRQAERFAQRDAQIYAQREQAYRQQVAPPPVAPPPVATQQPAPAADDTIAKLQQLAELAAQGVLTAEEFAAAKAKVIGI